MMSSEKHVTDGSQQDQAKSADILLEKQKQTWQLVLNQSQTLNS